MPAQDWAEVGPDKVADTIARLAELPTLYREWVRLSAAGQQLPALSLSDLPGPGVWSAWDVLVSRCERELRRQAEERENV